MGCFWVYTGHEGTSSSASRRLPERAHFLTLTVWNAGSHLLNRPRRYRFAERRSPSAGGLYHQFRLIFKEVGTSLPKALAEQLRPSHKVNIQASRKYPANRLPAPPASLPHIGPQGQSWSLRRTDPEKLTGWDSSHHAHITASRMASVLSPQLQLGRFREVAQDDAQRDADGDLPHQTRTPSSLFPITHLEVVGSTQEYALENINFLASSKILETPPDSSPAPLTAVLADRQTKGIGATGPWLSGSGNLLCTWIFTQETLPLRFAYLIATVGILRWLKATCDPAEAPEVKWPNDFLLNNKKAAGMLCQEARASDGVYTLVGLGLNIETCPPGCERFSSLAGRAMEEVARGIGCAIAKVGKEVAGSGAHQPFVDSLIREYTSAWRDTGRPCRLGEQDYVASSVTAECGLVLRTRVGGVRVVYNMDEARRMLAYSST